MRLWAVVAAFGLLSCREAAEPVVPPLTMALPAPLAAEPPKVQGIAGEVVAPDGATGATWTGRLALTWLAPDEAREFGRGNVTLTLIRHMIERMSVSDADIDLAKTPRIAYALTSAPADASAVAIFDVGHTFWETFEGGGKGLVGSGGAGGGTLRLVPNPPAPARAEACAGERYQLLVIDDPALGKRRFCAYLPASYKSAPARRYPLILMMSGFGSTDMAYLSGRHHAGDRLDAISKENGREAVIVGVDTSTALGSTYLEDAAPTGPWNTFLAKTALPKLDKELRILPGRTAHAVMGQSTGGYNALSYGMRHSELFSAIGASSPDAPDVEKWLFEPGTRHAHEWMRNWEHIEAAVGGAGQFTSWAANWSPDARAPRGFRYPIHPDTGVADETVLAQWVAKTPHGLVRDPAFLARVKKDLSGRIMIIVGRNDDFGLFAPAESFAQELNGLGVETRFVGTDHGHANHLERFEQIFPFLLERLDRAH